MDIQAGIDRFATIVNNFGHDGNEIRHVLTALLAEEGENSVRDLMDDMMNTYMLHAAEEYTETLEPNQQQVMDDDEGDHIMDDDGQHNEDLMDNNPPEPQRSTINFIIEHPTGANIDANTLYTVLTRTMLNSSLFSENVVVRLSDNAWENQKRYMWNKDDDECKICYREIQKEELVCEFPCNHYFHNLCAKNHVKTNYTCCTCFKEIGEKVTVS